MRTVLSFVFLLVLAVGAGACSGGGGDVTGPSQGSSSLSVTPPSATMRPGQYLTLTASGGDGSGFYGWESDRMNILDIETLSGANRRQIRLRLERLPTNGNTGTVTCWSGDKHFVVRLTFVP